VITQYDRVIGNGNHIHRETRGKVYRDDQGRVRTERVLYPGQWGEQFLRVTILDRYSIRDSPRSQKQDCDGYAHRTNRRRGDSVAPSKHGISLGMTPQNDSGQPAGPSTKIETQHSAANAASTVKTRAGY